MISRSVYATDVRIRREAETLAGAGHRVAVVGLGESEQPSPSISVLGVGEVSGIRSAGPRTARRGALYEGARWALLPAHRAAATRQFEHRVERIVADHGLTPDVVHAHDLPALAVGHQVASGTSAALVYDSHEIWGDMQRHGRPEPLARRASLRKQRELAADAAAVITVSEAAAEVLADRLGRGDITVIHNSFPTRDDLDTPDRPKGVVYSGRIATGRDLETAFTAFGDIPDFEFHLIGPTDDALVVPEFCHLHDPADLDVVERLLAEQGVALVPLEQGPLNHDVALPNKLFEAVSVGTPVIAADLPEMRRVVDSLDLGRVYLPGDAESLQGAVAAIRAEYPHFRAAVKHAQPQLDWSNDSSVLLTVYERIERGMPGTGAAPN